MKTGWVLRLLPLTLLTVVGRWRRSRVWTILMKTITSSWRDGFVHAGNLAYLSLLTLFPFFIVVATIAGSLGRTGDGLHAVTAFRSRVAAGSAAGERFR